MIQTPHRVDHYAINDGTVDSRMGRNQSRLLVASDVPCWVFDTTNRRDISKVLAAGREEILYTHAIHYDQNPRLTNDNVVSWIPDGESVALEMRFVGQKIPPSSTMPWVVYVNQISVAGS